ncbi:enoyl-CoA hydratase [Mesorhizobium australicum]|uniref:Enoyl-CoA hydratase domain-containing protein 3, mitochondrial n=1 Tax=Mesorhizobium australicum TaxID=536018 RepID=A0A1X7P3T4_9HYPH|nr:enoyl-CoA hydratase [Mesorhizobium australicum]SMH44853.1 Enoyl-CoA hydratase/carnithine racemase [Mesorhizobium australicum]
MAEVVAIRRDEPEGLVWKSREGKVLRVTLANRPANALSLEMMATLQQALDEARDDKGVRVVVIAAVPGKVFCAGHDLKQMTAGRNAPDKGEAFFEETFAACSVLMQSIVRHPKPIIAEVDGIATAAGCQLVASCDLAIASQRSTFGVNGIDVGLFCTTPGVALARGMKRKHAMEMLLTGEMVDAATAREFGIVNRVVPEEYLTQVVNKYAQVIAAKSPQAVAFGKKAFYDQVEMGLEDAYAYAGRVMVDNLLARDAEEGISAFISKRKPIWTEE